VLSGHVDVDDESFAFAAARELEEETGLRAEGLAAVATDDIVGDSCRRGSDAHRWHSFKVVFDTAIGPDDLKLNYELEEPVWLTFDEALETELSYPVRYVIELHRAELEGS
jgi:8-oxo-dGTP pyrophosphatase MutT (NUDIX family)